MIRLIQTLCIMMCIYTAQAQTRNTIIYPVEVMGKNGATESVQVNLQSPKSYATGLRLKIHGLTYNNKASIKINNSPWYNITTTNVTWQSYQDRVWQAISFRTDFTGPLSTFRFYLTVPNQYFDTNNVITFRFNDLNGLTVGYRVLDIGVITTNNVDLTLYTKSVQDDPSKWKPYSTNVANILNGSNQWFNATITHNGVPIRAKCTDCHARDGRDLKYFNYSNKSIVARSTALHSLSLQNSQDIASFIRTLNIPYEETGRPWNPPYQPGPGLDSKPVRSWAAGAGLEWVLDSDTDALTNIFPNGVAAGLKYPNGIKPFTYTNFFNQREQPLIVQLPDWNRWLPHIHPLDAYPEYFTNNNQAYLKNYTDYYNYFDTRITNKVVQAVNIAGNMDNMYRYFALYLNNWKSVYPYPNDQYSDARATAAFKWQGIYKWNMVKQWEISQEFGFEELGVEAYGVTSDDRRWLGGGGIPFRAAPHVSPIPVYTTSKGYFYGWYAESMAWYQLQLILNSGNRIGLQNGNEPIDWAYQHQLNYTAGNPQANYMTVATGWLGPRPAYSHGVLNVIKGCENMEYQPLPVGNPAGRDNGYVPYDIQMPDYLIVHWGNNDTAYNHIPAATRAAIVNNLMPVWLDKVNSYTLAQYQASPRWWWFSYGGTNDGNATPKVFDTLYNNLNKVKNTYGVPVNQSVIDYVRSTRMKYWSGY